MSLEILRPRVSELQIKTPCIPSGLKQLQFSFQQLIADSLWIVVFTIFGSPIILLPGIISKVIFFNPEVLQLCYARFRYSFISQGTLTRRQRRDLFILRVNSLTTQR